MSSMAYNAAAGLGGMLSAGSRHFSQDDNTGSVVLRNIQACLELSRMLSTSLGPQGRHKLVINHLGKLTVTSDCASILKDIEVEHPAAQLLKSAVQKQQEEFGDNTNFVLGFGGELLFETAKLISKMTWQPAPEIRAGYQKALDLVVHEYLPQLIVPEHLSVTNRDDVLVILKPVLASKVHGSEDILAPLVADACRSIMDDNNNNTKQSFNVEAIRTVKLIGSGVADSKLLSGYVSKFALLSTNQDSTDNAKIAVYACGFEASSTEAKSTVLMKTADDLRNYNITEESKMKEIVNSIVESGVKVVVSGGNISDMALHFLDRNNILVLKVSSKWELRRLCQAVSATALVRLGPPTPDEMGFCDKVSQQELAGKTITVFETRASKIATIVLRASTTSLLNDLERAVDDGVQAVYAFTKDQKLVYGGGAVEMALSVKLQEYAASTPGLEQYAIMAFAEALKVIPRTLVENAGWNTAQVLADLQTAHSTNSKELCDVGVDIRRDGTGTISMKKQKIYDLVTTKISALQLAVDAVITILKIDQIIMSKPAGGPKQG